MVRQAAEILGAKKPRREGFGATTRGIVPPTRSPHRSPFSMNSPTRDVDFPKIHPPSICQ